MARTPIHAAGGIVIRGRRRPLVAVVQRSKDERWVLPRGKLKRREDPVAAARREVVEETGHLAVVHEFLGAITYRTSGRPKVVQFWRMQAAERPNRDVMADILRVEWLPYRAAVRRLSFVLEKLFLAEVGRQLFRRKRRAGKSARAARKQRKSKSVARRVKPRAKAKRRTAKHGAAVTKPHRRKGKGRARGMAPVTTMPPMTSVPSVRGGPPRRASILGRVLKRFGR